MNEKLRRNIKLAIEKSGIQWQQMAKELNITYPYLYRVIQGSRRLKPEMIIKIAELTKTTPNELYGVDNKGE